MVVHLQLSMVHGKMTKSLVLVNGGNGGWDPRPNIAGRGNCPDKYCGYMPNQKEGMLPAARAAFMPMSDTRFKDLMKPAVE